MANGIEVDISLETQKAINSLRKFSNALDKQAKNGAKSFSKMDAALASFAGNLAANAVSGGLAALRSSLQDVVTDSIQFEKGLLGVGKTTNILGKDLQVFGKRISDLSSTIPVATDELLSIAQTAGQLGVSGSDNILKFTETVAKLTRTTDLTEESALSLARILNLSKNGVGDIDRFGAAIVSLGNKFETQEGQLVEIATRVAQSTASFKLASDELAGIAAAVSAVGGRAEAAGTVIGRTFRALTSVASKGGEPLVKLSQAIGRTVEETRKLAQSNPTKLFQEFIEGISKIEKTQIPAFLNQFGLSGERVLALLPSLAANTDKLSAALSESSKAYRENTALSDEFEIQSKSLDAQLVVLTNNFKAAGRSIFNVFAPAIKGAIQVVNDFFALSKESDSVANINGKLKVLQSQIEAVKNSNFPKAFEEAEIKRIQGNIDDLKNKLVSLKQETKNVSGTPSPGGEDGAVTPSGIVLGSLEDDPLVKREIEIQAEIDRIRGEAQLAREERKIEMKEIEGERTALDLEKLEEIEQQKIELQRVSELEKTGIIKSEEEQRKKIKEINAKFDLKAQKARFDSELKLERQKAAVLAKIEQGKVGVIQAAGNAASAFAKDGSKEQFLIQKAAAIAGSIVSTNLAAAQALATPPGPPFTIPLAAQAKVIGGLNTAAIVATAIKGFQDGGIVPGNSLSGDRVLARVNSGELILNQAQQENIAGQLGGNNSELVSAIMNQPIVIEIDGQEIARATRNAVRDGFAIA